MNIFGGEQMKNNVTATGCLSEGWNLVKDDYLIYLGASLFGLFLLYLLPLILQGPVYCGMFILVFQKMRAKPLSFDSFFDGFNHFLQSLLVTLVTVIPGLVLTVIVVVVAIVIVVSGATLEDGGFEGALVGSLGLLAMVFVVGIVVAISFQILMTFALPLVVEEGLGAIDACKRSASAVMDNLGLVVGLVALQSLLMVVGALACLIGVVFVFPIIVASTAVAYREIFGLNSTREGAII
jgi:hypothetical protein